MLLGIIKRFTNIYRYFNFDIFLVGNINSIFHRITNPKTLNFIVLLFFKQLKNREKIVNNLGSIWGI